MSSEQLLAEARALISRLSPFEVLSAQNAGALVVDTRCSEDRTQHGWIPGSVHIPRTVLEWRADPASEHRDPMVSAATQIIVFCGDGYSSSLAAANLVRLGHTNAADLDGGFRAWLARGFDVELPQL